MNKKLVWIVAALVVTIGASAIYYFFVKDRSQHLKYIPKDATLAIHFDLKGLHDKSDFEKVKKMKFFTKMMDNQSRYGNNQEWTDMLIKKPLSTGMDVLSQPVFFMSTRNDKMFMGMSIKLTSSGDFNRFMKKYKTSDEPKKSETYTSLALDGENFIVAWNDEAALFLSSNLKYHSNSKAEIEKVLDIYMTQDEKESLASNEDYHKFRKEKQDMGLFLTADKLFDYMGTVFKSRMYYSDDMMNKKEQMEKMKAKYKGLNMGLTFSFENAGLIGKTFIYGENAAKIMQESGFTSKPLSDNIINTISNDQVLGTIFFNHDITKMIGEMMEQQPKMKDNMEKMATELGVTVNDLKNIFGGEMAFSFVDGEVLKKEEKYQTLDPETENIIEKTRTTETPMPYFTFTFNLKNNNVLQKLMDSLNNNMGQMGSRDEDYSSPMVEDNSGLREYNPYQYNDNRRYMAPKKVSKPKAVNHIEKRGDNYYFKQDNIEVSMIKTASGYTITNSPKIAAAFEKNKSLSADPKLIGKDFFSKNSLGFKLILDADKYPKPFLDYIKANYVRDETPWKILKNFKEFSIQKPASNITEADFVLTMSEGKGNSLYRLLEIIDESF